MLWTIHWISSEERLALRFWTSSIIEKTNDANGDSFGVHLGPPTPMFSSVSDISETIYHSPGFSLLRKMIRIFFDIETYSPDEHGPSLCDKVISIAYKIGDSDVVVLKEWELDEKAVLSAFLDVIHSQYRPNIIGHNILMFDIPVRARERETSLFI